MSIDLEVFKTWYIELFTPGKTRNSREMVPKMSFNHSCAL